MPTIKIRLLVASVDKAREIGIDWWEHDPTLSSGQRDLAEENRRLRQRVGELEAGRTPELDDSEEPAAMERGPSRPSLAERQPERTSERRSRRNG